MKFEQHLADYNHLLSLTNQHTTETICKLRKRFSAIETGATVKDGRRPETGHYITQILKYLMMSKLNQKTHKIFLSIHSTEFQMCEAKSFPKKMELTLIAHRTCPVWWAFTCGDSLLFHASSTIVAGIAFAHGAFVGI